MDSITSIKSMISNLLFAVGGVTLRKKLRIADMISGAKVAPSPTKIKNTYSWI